MQLHGFILTDVLYNFRHSENFPPKCLEIAFLGAPRAYTDEQGL